MTASDDITAHLCGHNDWLAGPVAATNHHLLSNEDLLGRDLNAQVTTSNHDAIAGSEDFVKVLHSLFTLNLEEGGG